MRAGCETTSQFQARFQGAGRVGINSCDLTDICVVRDQPICLTVLDTRLRSDKTQVGDDPMRALLLCSTWLVASTIVTGPAGAVDPPVPYPGAAPGGTRFLDHAALLGSANDPEWFLNNIPFLEVPDTDIQQVYYYRWQTYKEHLTYTGPIYGWLSTEFLQPASYGAPYGGIDAAAGHQTIEGRWLRNQQYVKDNINYWLNGPGQFTTPATNNPDAVNWAHQYSFWAATAVWQAYLANGDQAFAEGQLPQLVRQYQGWDNHFNPALGLYWQVPVWDATEFTPESFETNDPFGGGAGYLPTINAYQYGDANAIADIAAMSGQYTIAMNYENAAKRLRRATQNMLWDRSRNFFYPIQRDHNPTNALLDTREEEGFVPFMFELPLASDAAEDKELLDPQGFAASYGPTTAERRSRWFDFQDTDCCHWDGPSWPYQTSQTLTGLANLLIDYPAQAVITPTDYVNALHTYAATQFRNGTPYVAEAHDADQNKWIYDTYDHSEDYNHSTYNDNVISGLIGLRGQSDATLVIDPLAPPTWNYFALENTPYHGHNITVLWDRTGARYGQGVGMRVFVDGALAAAKGKLSRVSIDVGNPITQNNICGTVDVAVNTQHYAYDTQPIASYTFSADNIWNGIDGIVYRTGIPEDSRWTSYNSPNQTDYYGANFQRNVTLREADLTFYDDGGGVRTPTSYDLQYWNGSAWLSVPNQTRADPQPVGNASNRITFPALTTSQLRVVAPNAGGGTGWGLSELRALSRPVFQIDNFNSNLLIGVQGGSNANGAQAVQAADDGSLDNLWELEDAGGGTFKLLNLGSHLVLGVQGGSTADSALVQQQSDTNSASQLFQFIDTGSGQFQIENKNSGLLLGVTNESKSTGANVVQFSNNGSPDHLWLLKSADDPASAEACK